MHTECVNRPTLALHVQYLRQLTDLDLTDYFGLVWGCLELNANSFVIGTAVINTHTFGLV